MRGDEVTAQQLTSDDNNKMQIKQRTPLNVAPLIRSVTPVSAYRPGIV